MFFTNFQRWRTWEKRYWKHWKKSSKHVCDLILFCIWLIFERLIWIFSNLTFGQPRLEAWVSAVFNNISYRENGNNIKFMPRLVIVTKIVHPSSNPVEIDFSASSMWKWEIPWSQIHHIDMKEKYEESHKKLLLRLFVLCSYKVLGTGSRVNVAERVVRTGTYTQNMSTAAFFSYVFFFSRTDNFFFLNSTDLNEYVLNNIHQHYN